MRDVVQISQEIIISAPAPDPEKSTSKRRLQNLIRKLEGKDKYPGKEKKIIDYCYIFTRYNVVRKDVKKI